MKLLDTSIIIDHLKGYAPATSVIDDGVRSAEGIAASEVTRFELLAGVRPSERTGLEGFVGVVDWAPVTEDVARQAADYARRYRASHSGIGTADYLIAGSAQILGADLLTLNVRHFPMFDGLQPPYEYG